MCKRSRSYAKWWIMGRITRHGDARRVAGLGLMVRQNYVTTRDGTRGGRRLGVIAR